jgi:hypothetical protein
MAPQAVAAHKADTKQTKAGKRRVPKDKAPHKLRCTTQATPWAGCMNKQQSQVAADRPPSPKATSIVCTPRILPYQAHA